MIDPMDPIESLARSLIWQAEQLELQARSLRSIVSMIRHPHWRSTLNQPQEKTT